MNRFPYATMGEQVVVIQNRHQAIPSYFRSKSLWAAKTLPLDLAKVFIRILISSPPTRNLHNHMGVSQTQGPFFGILGTYHI